MEETRDERIGAIDFRGDEAGDFARDFVFGGDVFRDHLGRGFDRAERVAQFVGESGRELAEGGEAVAAAEILFGFFDLRVGGGELAERAARFLGLLAEVGGEGVGEEADHHQDDDAEHEFGHSFRRDFEAVEVQKAEKRKVSAAGAGRD